jgi:hypothetical protein
MELMLVMVAVQAKKPRRAELQKEINALVASLPKLMVGDLCTYSRNLP